MSVLIACLDRRAKSQRYEGVSQYFVPKSVPNPRSLNGPYRHVRESTQRSEKRTHSSEQRVRPCRIRPAQLESPRPLCPVKSGPVFGRSWDTGDGCSGGV